MFDLLIEPCNIQDVLLVYLAFLRKLVRLEPEDPTTHYNLACSLCLKGRKADAVKALRAALALGYKDFDWMKHDPDLNDLSDYSGFLKLLNDLGIT